MTRAANAAFVLLRVTGILGLKVAEVAQRIDSKAAKDSNKDGARQLGIYIVCTRAAAAFASGMAKASDGTLLGA